MCLGLQQQVPPTHWLKLLPKHLLYSLTLFLLRSVPRFWLLIQFPYFPPPPQLHSYYTEKCSELCPLLAYSSLSPQHTWVTYPVPGKLGWLTQRWRKVGYGKYLCYWLVAGESRKVETKFPPLVYCSIPYLLSMCKWVKCKKLYMPL